VARGDRRERWSLGDGCVKANDPKLLKLLTGAVRCAAMKLFQETHESFYYFSLITTGEALSPIVSAWSWEKFAMVPQQNKEYFKWSYADSPYFNYGDEYFTEIKEIFSELPDIRYMDDIEGFIEYETRLKVMESSLRVLDGEGLFGTGSKRNGIVINVEVMPPDYTNTLRALRLNPVDALRDWLVEAAEKE